VHLTPDPARRRAPVQTAPDPRRAWPTRPVLPVALRRLWRDRATLQLGRAPGRALVLEGVDEHTRRTLALLDGTRDPDRLLREAASAGCPPGRAEELLTLLAEAGLLEDAGARAPATRELPRPERDRRVPDVGSLSLVSRGRAHQALERRAHARVHVAGAGRVGSAVAMALAAAGVGAVDIVDDGIARPHDVGVAGLQHVDVGRSRGEAARERLRAATPSVRCEPLPTPDLVVLAPVGVLDELAVADCQRRGVAHLVAEVREQVGVVGPLVLPGRSSCLRCLDLTRTDRDPGWPVLAAQLATPATGDACDSVLALSVAAQACQQVLALLDEVVAPATLEGTLELALPDWRWRRRSWPAHPACGCAWPATG
jgi:hypothetical protein